MKVVKGFRFVTADLKSENGNIQWQIGEWQHQDGELQLCGNGFHASKQPLDSLTYPFGTRWFRCEARGKILTALDKFCASDMRIIEEIPIQLAIRRFAYECALHVLPIYEKKYPGDNRVRDCLAAVKRFLDAPTEEHEREMAAARDAAWSAAWGAAGDAAWSAAWAAAWAAAGDAAWAAARDAAWTAAGEAAGDAAGAAARDAAGDAAGDAAWAKERRWQNRKLNQILKTFIKVKTK